MIIDQANAEAESNGRFFNKTNLRIDSNRKSECCSNKQCIMALFQNHGSSPDRPQHFRSSLAPSQHVFFSQEKEWRGQR